MFVLFVTVTAGETQAKLLPRYKATTTTKSSARPSGNAVAISAKFMSGKTGLRVSYSNLAAANSVSYTLSYTQNGKPEGVVGSVQPSEGSTSRDLLFGTCSGGKCVYHKGIKNMKLVVTAQLKNGKKQVKTFNVKV